jgi:hypothetical protein
MRNHPRCHMPPPESLITPFCRAPHVAAHVVFMTALAAKSLLVVAVLAFPAACTTPPNSMSFAPETSPVPPMRWDHRPEARVWTEQTLQAVAENDHVFAETIPSDVTAWCPGYASASLSDRRSFWVAMLSTLAKHESTWNPAASGGGGKWIGLTQIDPRTARNYGCEADTVGELKNGADNLRCAVQIAAVQVPKDNMVAGAGKSGLGRDWAPFRNASKREDMRQWVRQQPYCQPGGSLSVSAKGN